VLDGFCSACVLFGCFGSVGTAVAGDKTGEPEIGRRSTGLPVRGDDVFSVVSTSDVLMSS